MQIGWSITAPPYLFILCLSREEYSDHTALLSGELSFCKMYRQKKKLVRSLSEIDLNSVVYLFSRLPRIGKYEAEKIFFNLLVHEAHEVGY